MIKTGNLFELARKQLRKKHKPFTVLNIFDRAVEIRKELDETEIKKEREYNHRYYLKYKNSR